MCISLFLKNMFEVSAYSKYETYKKVLEIFITVKNLKIKGGGGGGGSMQ